MRNQQDQRDPNQGTADQGRLPRRDRSNVEDVPDNAADRGVREDRTIDEPRVREERRAPGAENAEDELDDEDFEGDENVR